MTYTLSHDQARALMLGMRCPAWCNVEKYLTNEDSLLFDQAIAILNPATRGDGTTAHSRPVTTALQIIDQNPGHTRATLWVGRTAGSRGAAGEIVIRTDEFTELAAMGWVDEVRS